MRARIVLSAGVALALLASAGAHAGRAAKDTPAVDLRAPWIGDIDGMEARHYIRFLVVPSRTAYFVDHGRQYGIAAEFSHEFEKFVHKKLGGPKIAVAIIPVGRDKILSGIVDGTGDVAASNLKITPERQSIVDFGAPIMDGVRELLVTHDRDGAAKTIDWLSGRRVWVRKASAYYVSLVAQSAAFEKAGKKPIDIEAADEQLEDEDLLELVNAGVIEATIVDDHLAEFWDGVFPHVTVHEGVALREEGEIAWAMRKESPKLRAIVDEFCRTHRRGTLFGNVVLKRYLEHNTWVKNPTAKSDRKRFEATMEFFRRYGAQYDLPSLLIAAQAYQESGIDQAKRNRSGAVGIMQIKPTTAAGAPILINGVDKSAERNIEAGAKYLRFIVDEYYQDEPIGRIDKDLFAIASYNAGPARITRLRAKAASMGLDPNRWFGNVEVAVEADIGRETVQYVSNIYKYYVAYELLTAQEARSDAAKSAVPDE